MNIVSTHLKRIVEEYREYYPERDDPLLCLNALQWTNDWRKVKDTGICFRVGEFIRDLVPESTLRFAWCSYKEEDGDGFEDMPVHCFVEYRGRYYDPATPDGVGSPKELSWFVKHPHHFVSPSDAYDVAAEIQFEYARPSLFIEHLKTLPGMRIPSVTDYLNWIMDHYLAVYPDRSPPQDWINQCREAKGKVVAGTGICYQIIRAIASVYPSLRHTFIYATVKAEGDDEYYDYPLHCVIHHNDRFYDTFNPNGVTDINKLEWTVSQGLEGEVFLPQDDQEFTVAEACYRAIPFDDFTYKLFSKIKELSAFQ